jgi:hypothetical protein
MRRRSAPRCGGLRRGAFQVIQDSKLNPAGCARRARRRPGLGFSGIRETFNSSFETSYKGFARTDDSTFFA